MTESALEKYFNSQIAAHELLEDVIGSQSKTGADTKEYYIDPISDSGEYTITRQHLKKLCLDTLTGIIGLEDLNTIAFALSASDYFTWDAMPKEDYSIIDNTLFAWDNPGISVALTRENLKLWLEYLDTGHYPF